MVGEHLRALRGGRWTHAIDCGDETLIHLADDATPSRVRRSYRPEFVAGAETVEVVTHRERTFPANEVVARAYSRIADPGLASMFRDSEAFAEWCTTGRLPSAAPSRAVSAPEIAPVAPARPPAAQATAPAAQEERTRPKAKKGMPRRSAAKARKVAPGRASPGKVAGRRPATTKARAKPSTARKPARRGTRRR